MQEIAEHGAILRGTDARPERPCESAALTSLVTGLGSLPGRKTVVLFSEGITIPPAAEAKFRAVVDSANRANVSFYAVDAKGLKVHSDQRATARGIPEVGATGRRGRRPNSEKICMAR